MDRVLFRNKTPSRFEAVMGVSKNVERFPLCWEIHFKTVSAPGRARLLCLLKQLTTLNGGHRKRHVETSVRIV